MMYNLLKLGEKLKEIILDNKTSVKEVCQNTGLSTSQFYRWQNNTSVPTLNHLIILADYFKCSIDFLIGREDENSLIVFKKNLPAFGESLAQIIEHQQKKPYNVYTNLKISSSVFYNWLNGEYIPMLDNIIKLADYFDCSIDYLIGRGKY